MEEPDGATPLSEEECEGLKPGHMATRGELNEWEHTNIEQSEVWAFSRKRANVVTLGYVLELHLKMFGETWIWAGQFRRTEKNLGVPNRDIQVAVRNACDDAAYWLAHRVFPLPELAARYHHRLVFIHPIPNGNGRHARLIADLLLYNHDLPRLAWGGVTGIGDPRTRYIQALRAADDGDLQPLLRYLNLAGYGV